MYLLRVTASQVIFLRSQFTNKLVPKLYLSLRHLKESNVTDFRVKRIFKEFYAISILLYIILLTKYFYLKFDLMRLFYTCSNLDEFFIFINIESK